MLLFITLVIALPNLYSLLPRKALYYSSSNVSSRVCLDLLENTKSKSQYLWGAGLSLESCCPFQPFTNEKWGGKSTFFICKFTWNHACHWDVDRQCMLWVLFKDNSHLSGWSYCLGIYHLENKGGDKTGQIPDKQVIDNSASSFYVWKNFSVEPGTIKHKMNVTSHWVALLLHWGLIERAFFLY